MILLLIAIYAIKPTMIRVMELPRITLLFTSPVKKHATKMIAPSTIKIRPKFFNKLFICVYFIVLFFLLQIKE